MTARKPLSAHAAKGTHASPTAQRPTQHCTRCGSTFRRKVDRDRPCSRCGGATSSAPVRDFERHAVVIGSRSTTWTDDDVAAVLRQQRERARDG